MARLPKRQYDYPWRDGNQIQLLVDADQFYPAMLNTINNAHSHVWLEMYLFESGQIATQFIDSLCAAVKRNVQVNVLLDDFGSSALSKNDRKRMREQGVELHFYNPVKLGEFRRSLFRDHRKLLLVDNKLVFIGGAGITDDFSPDTQKRYWRETMLCLQGPCVHDWAQLFSQVWKMASLHRLQIPQSAPLHVTGGVNGRATCTHGMGSQEIKRSLVKRIRSAERHVWLATAYFVPSRKIMRALRAAALRGVDVRLLLPGKYTDHPAVRHAGRRFYGGLLKSGVRIFEYQPRFLHQKIIVSDSWVSIGSSNIDRWNFRWNLEANQEVDSDLFSREVMEMFEKDFSQSREVSIHAWLSRPRHRRFLEWFWGRVDIWLERLGLSILNRK